MSDSALTVIDFDKLPNIYSKGKEMGSVPKSNDALYISDEGIWYFIEFKNGEVCKEDIYRKIYDSLIMLIELNVIPNFNFCRENIQYILVYNSNKYDKVQQSESRKAIFENVNGLAKKESKLFNVKNFDKYLFQDTHTYTKEQFEEKFTRQMEKEVISV